MNFQELADSFHAPTCIVSVRKTPDGSYDEIRLVAGNAAYLAPIEHPAFTISPDIPAGTVNKFVPNSLYENYIPKDLGFEDLCFRSAVQKMPIHTYVHLNHLNIWFDIFAMPIDNADSDICYCTYTTQPCEPARIGLSGGSTEDILRTCIKLHATKDFRQTMQEVIQDIRRICRAEVCTIALMNPEEATYSVLATSIDPGSTIKRVTMFGNFYDIVASWTDTIGDSDCLIIKSDKDMQYIKKINYPWYLTLAEAGVQSVVMFPLRYNQEVLGFIWATNFDICDTMRIKETLELTTFFISSQVASYKMMRRLERISYTDLLTGVKNRNAMNNRVTVIADSNQFHDTPFGVIFADLNGLKRVNDTCGHYAGDLLLKKSALLLQELFGGNDVYRAGGDEFVILIPDCDEDEFAERVCDLIERTADPDNVCFAVGQYYTASGTDIREAMHFADEDMYKQKSLYYSVHPERKHR